MPIRFADKAGDDNIVDLWVISLILLIGNVMWNNFFNCIIRVEQHVEHEGNSYTHERCINKENPCGVIT